jgi:hypothetical protein
MGEMASVDPEALKAFRSRFIRFNDMLAEERTTIRSAWIGLRDVWHDRKYEELGDSLAQVETGIDQYLKSTKEYETHLLRLIERAQAYLDT